MYQVPFLVTLIISSDVYIFCVNNQRHLFYALILYDDIILYYFILITKDTTMFFDDIFLILLCDVQVLERVVFYGNNPFLIRTAHIQPVLTVCKLSYVF